MIAEKKIRSTLKAGEEILNDAVENSSHQKYMMGYTNALKYVLGEKQDQCIISKI